MCYLEKMLTDKSNYINFQICHVFKLSCRDINDYNYVVFLYAITLSTYPHVKLPDPTNTAQYSDIIMPYPDTRKLFLEKKNISENTKINEIFLFFKRFNILLAAKNNIMSLSIVESLGYGCGPLNQISRCHNLILMTVSRIL